MGLIVSESHTAASDAIDRAATAIADDPEIRLSVLRNNLVANMAGELFVRDIELQSATRKLVSVGEFATSDSFVRLPFDAAIEHFRSREILSSEEFAALEDLERSRAFTVQRVLSNRIRERMHERLAAAMDPEGPGLAAFIEEFQQQVISGGGGPIRSYLENVYRTNTATSYGAGRYRAQTSDLVRQSTGFWKYLSVQDDRTRDSHAALHRMVWEIGADDAQAVYPPNGSNCRCVMIVVDREDVTDADLSRAADIDAAIQDGFRGAPTTAIETEALAA